MRVARRVVLVPGTWEAWPGRVTSVSGWTLPGSAFVRSLGAAGFDLVTVPSWTTKLDGIIGRNDWWVQGGQELGLRLLNYQQAGLTIDALVAWSHGGNVAAYALAFMAPSGLRLSHLVTLGTPVRNDLAPFYSRARSVTRRWTHMYGGSDWWQVLGMVGDGVLRYARGMPLADANVFVPGARHQALVDATRVIAALKEGTP